MVWTNSHCGQTMKHIYSFKMDRFEPQDRWSGPLGALEQINQETTESERFAKPYTSKSSEGDHPL